MRVTADRSNLLSNVNSFNETVHINNNKKMFPVSASFFSNAKFIEIFIFKASMDFCIYRPGRRRFIPTNNRQKAAIFH